MDTEAFSMQKLYRHGDRIMVSVSWILFLITLGLAGWHDTWTEAFAIGLPSAAIPTFMLFVMPGSLLSRLTNATAFMFLSALMIHQGHGMIEMHFGIFVLLAFLLFYRDWAPIVVAAGVIAVHHLVFNYLQASGSPVYVFETRTGIDIVMVHAAYVVFESVILIYMANIFRKEAIQSEELHEIGAHLNINNGVIDLTYRKNDARSEFSNGFNAFMEAIHTAISNAINAAGQLSSATEQMFQITERSSRGAQQQRAETEQVATAMHEMTATVQEVARNAEQAANGARSADDEAKRGHGVVSETISVINTLAREVEHASDVIQRLESESGNIGTVLDVIRGIAEQTNLLALNAAIEAARAGEQGRGFAVVADEVRTLASRTQTSTAEIRSMIERLQSGSKEAVAVMEQGRIQANAGVSQAAKAGESLKTIAQAIATIRDMNTQIATAAEEQSCVAEEINRNITNISRVADETAGDLQQTEDSSEQLSRLSMQFTSLVGNFKV